MPLQCTAINLSDEIRCEEAATSLNGLFCRFHSKQCQGLLFCRAYGPCLPTTYTGLYRGYKLRNSRLDLLSKSPPTYLISTEVALANQTFADVSSEATLQELHAYLTLKHALLDRVIRARKIHHTRFFSMNLDYGR